MSNTPTDSTNNSIKESESDNYNFSEDNFNYMNIITNETKFENIEFIPPKGKLKWILLLQNVYHFKQDIERVYLFLRNFELLSIISNEGQFPCINIKGKDTWKVGNTFKGNLYKIIPYVAKVEKNLNLPEIKEIKWLFNNIKDNDYFEIKLNIFKVTEDNSTVVLKTIKTEEKGLKALEEKKNIFNSIKVFKTIEDHLENEPINLLRYESGIIKGQMQEIFDILTDSNKISAIAPNNDIMPNYNLKDLKIGEKIQVSITKDNIVQTAEVVLKCRETNPRWNKWLLVVEIFGGQPKKIPKHTSLFQLTKINNIECQLIMLTKYHEPIDCKEFKEFTKKKKYLIMSLKDYFDNFYSPEASNQ